MTEFERIAEEILGLLDAERHLLCEGTFDLLGDLARKKDLLIERLTREAGPPSSMLLPRVREKALANLALFEAAKRGLRDAQDRLDRIRRETRCFRTYDSGGRHSDVGGPAPRHERRA
jgi:hypothetical protein